MGANKLTIGRTQVANLRYRKNEALRYTICRHGGYCANLEDKPPRYLAFDCFPVGAGLQLARGLLVAFTGLA